MEENLNPIPEPVPETSTPEPKFLARGKEFAFGGVMLVLGVLMCNFVIYGGVHLAFGVIAALAILCSWVYVKKSGGKFGWYENALLILSLIICGGFGRSDDGAVKFYMLLFLFVAVNLALCTAAGQNRRSPHGAMSLLDAPRAFYRLGIGNAPAAGKGMVEGFKRGGAATRRVGAVGTGLLISVPILAAMIVLLMDADAAFEGLMDLLPEFRLEEYIMSVVWGFLLAMVLYSRGVSLAKADKPAAAVSTRKGLNALTVNTVLAMVCLMYTVYLFSQLAYISGGLSGILPEEFTMAEYARRGFFEMSTLCTINLGLLCGCIWLIRAESLPRLTKIAGSFIGLITLFLVVTASAKMFLYIGSYGLTWSRVTTEVFMLWLAVTTVLVTIRLFLPKFGYMKAVVLTAMVLGSLVFWVDVDSLVASYNVRAYQSGKLETVDVSHLGNLGSAGVPWLIQLTEDADPEVAEKAREVLDRATDWGYYEEIEDFRHWNLTAARGARAMADYRAEEDANLRAHLLEQLGFELTTGTVTIDRGHAFEPEEGRRFLRFDFTKEEAETLETQLAEAGWEELPMDALVRLALTEDKGLFNEFRSYYTIPNNTKGLWYFRDLHPDGDGPENLYKREGYRFVLAWYDAQTRRLYYLEVDTLEIAQNA